MAGYERVYRGRPSSDPLDDPHQHLNNPQRYYNYGYNRDIIRPLDLSHSSLATIAQDNSPEEDEITITKSIGLGCGLASIITENLLIHPFIVLRRQCQVNPKASTYHLVPITLIPVILRLHQSQGLHTLWKGIGSVLLVRGLTLAVEDFFSKITSWPKERNSQNSVKAFGKHLLLKCVSIGIVTPFYSASLVETVQSEIASERPGIFDVFRDGIIRLLEFGSKGRLIPIYALLVPHISYGISKYLFALIFKNITSKILFSRDRHVHERTGAYSKELSLEIIQDIQLHSTIVSMCAADVIFYPLETVLHRLHLQGTRTIIDNLDTGRSVVPLLTGYSGAFDCYRTIISTEGVLGLYKGFGALVFQFSIHFFVLKATKYILIEIGTIFKQKTKVIKSPPPIYNEV